jgi:hypothetical protein
MLSIANETTFSALDWVPALGDPLDVSRQSRLCVTPDALMSFVGRCPRPVCPGDPGYDVAAEGSCYYETCDFLQYVCPDNRHLHPQDGCEPSVRRCRVEGHTTSPCTRGKIQGFSLASRDEASGGRLGCRG